jgi:hypothetical protein
MRIAVSGTSNQGKSTLINDFLVNWPHYKLVNTDYRSILKTEKLPHSKRTNKDTQWRILNLMVDEMQKYKKQDNVLFDRCTLDNIVYSLWSCDKKKGKIDEAFITKCIPIVRESMSLLDIIFFIPITKAAPINIVDNGVRETDDVYIKEIDALFKSLCMQYKYNLGRTPFFPADDSPGIIEIFGNPVERIEMVKWYIDAEGDLIGGDVNSPDNLFNPQNLEEMGKLLESQKTLKENEVALAGELAKIKDFVKKTGAKF